MYNVVFKDGCTENQQDSNVSNRTSAIQKKTIGKGQNMQQHLKCNKLCVNSFNTLLFNFKCYIYSIFLS